MPLNANGPSQATLGNPHSSHLYSTPAESAMAELLVKCSPRHAVRPRPHAICCKPPTTAHTTLRTTSSCARAHCPKLVARRCNVL